MDETESKISNSTAVYMVATALVIDLIQLIVEIIGIIFIGAVINVGIDIFTGGTFYLWFRGKGVSFNTSKKMVTLGASVFIKLVPLIQVLPAWTFLVVRTIVLTRAEEKIATVAPVAAAITRPRVPSGPRRS